MICPECHKRVRKTHFMCVCAARAGRAGTGAAKARSREQAQEAGRLGGLAKAKNHAKSVQGSASQK